MTKKILVIDDSEAILNLAKTTLELESYDVQTAINGQEGLELVKNSLFDLIISDIHMPIMDGIEFTHQVRQLVKHQYTPILILTAESDFEMKMEGKKAGATGWIVKPIVAEQLINTVSRVFAS